MPNVPFHTFPSFSGVSRYEHSLGVAHLAQRWGLTQPLEKHLVDALSIAALYHDSATPAFSHLYEDYLSAEGFDHEKALVSVLDGTTSLVGSEYAQVFLGRHCLLRDLLPYDSPDSLSVALVIRILTGTHPLSCAISGAVDLDNIDNVIRATSAMGIAGPYETVHPYAVVEALALQDGCVRPMPRGAYAVSQWQRLRRKLYGAILGSESEFRTQTAVRWAIEARAAEDPALTGPDAWVYTEPVLVFEHLRKSSFSKYLIDQVRLGEPPPLLFSAWSEDISPVLRAGGLERLRCAAAELSNLCRGRVHLNYYVDKRERAMDFSLTGQLALFQPGPRATSAVGGSPGLIGGVRLTESAFDAGRDGTGSVRTFNTPSPEMIGAILERCLDVDPSIVSHGWVGTHEHD